MNELGLVGRRYTREEAASTKNRFRNWWSILYPDSAVEGWADILSSLGVQALVSPLHDMDDNATGEKKKPHFHLLLCFEQVKSAAQVDEIFEKVGALHGFAGDGKTAFQAVYELRGAARYLCHLDNPEKCQYDPSAVQCFGGVDYWEICCLPKDEVSIVGDMLDFCKANVVLSYRQLLSYSRDNEPSWFKYLCTKGSRHMSLILKSLKWEIEAYGRVLPDDPRAEPVKINPETGEVEND